MNADARIDSVALLKVKNHNIKFIDEWAAKRWQRRLERHAGQRFAFSMFIIIYFANIEINIKVMFCEFGLMYLQQA